ncbi:glycoside hydrolase family 1 protein [Panaeolus papilionaceus]|nr:glycoside hydrolase family 1 protein [Panaeolus papilionaceus]
MPSNARWAAIFLSALLPYTASQIVSADAGKPTPSPTKPPSPPVPTTIAPTPTVGGGVNFPRAGAVSKDFSPAGLQRLWDIVGPVQAPPFTTTPAAKLPIQTPASPPALYPTWFSPSPSNIFPHLKFPKDFLFGVATAAYQVEGAVKNDGKGPTMWDWNSRQPNGVLDGTTGDIVDLHYYLYKQDVARVAALGINAHSLSISWARIFPFGTADSPVSQAGLKHYSDVIDYHNQMGVEPVVTLFHWDVPLALQAYYGGFSSEKIVDDFVNYAKTVFKAYNGRVKTWYTFNEPQVYCGQIAGYPFNAALAPGVDASVAPFHCAYYTLKAHAGAVKAFREMGIKGEIAFKNDNFVGVPWRANNTEDAQAVERHAAFQIGIFSDPVYNTGDWPKLMTDILPPSTLPRFTDQEKKDNLGSADFFAIDPYRTSFVAAPQGGIAACLANKNHPLWPGCNDVKLVDPNGWAGGPSSDPATDTWLQATPNFVRQNLGELHRRWPSKKMYVSEFGYCEPFESMRTEVFRITEDVTRTNYYMTYLGEILLAIHEDKLPIAGTFAWAMMDNAEWGSGLEAKFGIQYVNYTTLERTYKRSAISLGE